MKPGRRHLFIAISSMSLALLVVMIIQVNWILETARIKEQMFNEKANMVLSKTAEALSSDPATVKQMEILVGRSETHKIDSLLAHYMKIYNVTIDYHFEVKIGSIAEKKDSIRENRLKTKNKSGIVGNVFEDQANCYQTCVSADGSDASLQLELKLIFPDKEEYIIREMGLPFIASVILIVLVLVMSWRTILSLMKEKEISEHTTDFLNNMTHEFKTPLTNIALAGKMLIKDANIKQEEKIRHYSGIILEENEKLRLQVEQVLSMTALERGEIPLRKTELDLHQVINDCLKCMSVQIEHKEGRIDLSLAAENFVVMGDKTHLTNALCNLLDNAIKYSKESMELSIQTFNSDHNFVLMITDNGIGIEEEYRKKVFDKFFRVPTGNVHDVKGFGLGLTYIKGIVDLHSGTIELRSEKGVGSSFTITVPYV